MKSIALIILTAILSSCGSGPVSPSSLTGGVPALLPSTPVKGDVFDYYEPKGQSKLKGNWTTALDLSGVSWNDNRTCTLISRQHVVMAAHFVRPSDVPVMFHDRSGKPHERYIIAVKSLAPRHDIAIGKLNLPLPSEVKSYTFAPAAAVRVGMDAIITDQTKTISIHQIRILHDDGRISFFYNPNLDPIYRRNLIVGDSGNPSFVLVGGDLKLLETHTYGGTGSGPNYSHPSVQADVIAALHSL